MIIDRRPPPSVSSGLLSEQRDWSRSASFPTTPGAYDTDWAAAGEGYVLKLGTDSEAPAITCDAADGVWHADDVSLECTASDAGSGLADSTDASFLLVTNIAAGIESADAQTESHEVCDNAGNCTTAGPIGGNKIDKRSPAIAVTTPAAGAYLLNQGVAAGFDCTDSGSGMGTCVGPVTNGAAIDTSTVGSHTFNVTATDAVGNMATSSVASQS